MRELESRGDRSLPNDEHDEHDVLAQPLTERGPTDRNAATSRPCEDGHDYDSTCIHFRALSSTHFVRCLRSKLTDRATNGDDTEVGSATGSVNELGNRFGNANGNGHWNGGAAANGNGNRIGHNAGGGAGVDGGDNCYQRPPVNNRSSHTRSSAIAEANVTVSPLDQLCTRTPLMTGSNQNHDRGWTGPVLSQQQEEHHLRLFWQSHHLLFPILDEASFMKTYSTLWDYDAGYRRPSALVEIVLALCVQCSAAFAPAVYQPVDAHPDADLAGWSLYLQSENLLLQERDSPQWSTVQTSILIVVYLLNVSRPSAAQVALAAAVTIARTLDLNRSEAMTEDHRSRTNLLMASLNILDTTVGLDRSGPFLLLPSDSPGASSSPLLPSDPYVNFANVNLNDCHRHCAALAIIVRSMRATLLEPYIRRDRDAPLHQDTFPNPQLLEHCAILLQRQSRQIQQWTHQIPDMLRLPRKGSSESFSTQQSPLDIDSYVPLWLQRQRVSLELFFHQHMMLLYRSFVFPPETGSPSLFPTSAGHGVSSALHATAITSIIDQVIVSSDVLNAVHAVYSLQRDALLVLAAFAVSHPLCSHTRSAIHAMQTAAATFQLLADKNHLGAARDTAGAAYRLLDQVVAITGRFHHSSSITSSSRRTETWHSDAPNGFATLPASIGPAPILPSDHNAFATQFMQANGTVPGSTAAPSFDLFPGLLPSRISSPMTFDLTAVADELAGRP